MIRRTIAMLACVAAVVGAGTQSGWAQGRGAGAEPGERFVLSGVIIHEGGGIAWIQEPSLTGNQTVAVRLSDSIGPYRLTKILDDRIELQGPGGTVLVPVYGGQAAPGPAVAMTGDGAAAPATPHTSGPGQPTVVPQGASPEGVPPSARALRDRLEVARRHVQQLQAGGQPVAQQSLQGGQPSQVAAPKATIGQPGAGAGTAGTTGAPQTGTPATGTPAQGSGQVAAPTSNGGPNDVVIADKRQTFQQMLGLGK